MANPEQEIFSEMMGIGIRISGWNLYDCLPGRGTRYPFIFIGEQYGGNKPVKAGRIGTVEQSVHFYSDDKKRRGDVSAAMGEFIAMAMELRRTYSYNVDCSDYRSQVIWDNTTGTPLIHGILEFTVNYY